jgi:hypothetical protein
MGATIKGADLVLKRLSDMPKQVRFATSQAINQTLREVQTWTLNTALPGQFTLRARGAPWQRPGTKFGFNIRFAHRENLTGVLGSQADWLEHQEAGGVKAVEGHRIAVPTPFWKRREEIMSREKKPKALLRAFNKAMRDARTIEASKNTAKARRAARTARNQARKHASAVASLAFTPFMGRGKLHPGIYVRTTKNALPIKALFTFVPRARIKGGLHFERRGEQIVQKNFGPNFNRALVKAIITAK